MIGVLGAGAFGSALARSYAGQEPVRLWARNPRTAAINAADMGANARLTSDIRDLSQCDVILLAVPMQHLRSVLTKYHDVLTGRTLVICCKGIELGTGLGPHDVVAEVAPGAKMALLTGPSFAVDIAQGLPTALTLATTGETDLQARLSTPVLRLYRTDDVVGAAMGGALKNVMAIACGAVMGAGLGASARASLMTRGYAEMVRYATAQGGRAETLAGLSGLGDLALTCMSEQSRNYQLGVALGADAPFDPGVTVEGAATARAIKAMAGKIGVDMPVTHCVTALLDKSETVSGVLKRLMARPLKEETPC